MRLPLGGGLEGHRLFLALNSQPLSGIRIETRNTEFCQERTSSRNVNLNACLAQEKGHAMSPRCGGMVLHIIDCALASTNKAGTEYIVLVAPGDETVVCEVQALLFRDYTTVRTIDLDAETGEVLDERGGLCVWDHPAFGQEGRAT